MSPASDSGALCGQSAKEFGRESGGFRIEKGLAVGHDHAREEDGIEFDVGRTAAREPGDVVERVQAQGFASAVAKHFADSGEPVCNG